VEFLFGLFGWRPIFLLLAAVTVAALLMIWFLVPERGGDAAAPSPGASGGVRGQMHDLGLIYASPFFWRVCLVSVLHNAVYLSYQALWMGPWLRDVAGMPLPAIAQALLLFNLGMFIGVLGIGVMADRLQRFGIRPIAIMGGGLGASLVVQAMFALEQTAIAVPLCFAFGFFGSSALLLYSVLGQEFPARLVGRVNTAYNMLSFTAAFAAQWGVGAIIGLWPELPGGLYDPAGHRAALLTVIGLEVLAFLWFVLPRRRGAGIPQ
jgi:predicted MFS family arabinose efflux permease